MLHTEEVLCENLYSWKETGRLPTKYVSTENLDYVVNNMIQLE